MNNPQDPQELIGCSNNSCLINPPKGMGTNGPCACLRDWRGQRYVQQLRKELEALRAEVERLENDLAIKNKMADGWKCLRIDVQNYVNNPDACIEPQAYFRNCLDAVWNDIYASEDES